jgi:2-C-methyl-D-erythritol 4-phosphate cytidylyltransferase
VGRLLVSVGGKERGDSVLHGLEDLPDEARIVVVHDAARPMVPMEVVDRVIAEARAGRGAVAALPLADTLKEVDADGRVVRTVPREGLWRSQTPQAFPRAMIEQAYAEARRTRTYATDCAALCEAQGFEVVVVRGSESAVKVTEEADFALVEAMTRAGK